MNAAQMQGLPSDALLILRICEGCRQHLLGQLWTSGLVGLLQICEDCAHSPGESKTHTSVWSQRPLLQGSTGLQQHHSRGHMPIPWTQAEPLCNSGIQHHHEWGRMASS